MNIVKSHFLYNCLEICAASKTIYTFMSLNFFAGFLSIQMNPTNKNPDQNLNRKLEQYTNPKILLKSIHISLRKKNTVMDLDLQKK